MNLASIELCKELYKLSEWETEYHYVYEPNGGLKTNGYKWQGPKYVRTRHNSYSYIPAYDLDYLIQTLPATIPSDEHPGREAHLIVRKDYANPHDKNRGALYFAWYAVVGDNDPADFGTHSSTPEDAVCKLAIKVFRLRTLTPDGGLYDSLSEEDKESADWYVEEE